MGNDRQARGYKGKLLLDFEQSFGVPPEVRKTFQMPYNTCGVVASREQNTAETVTGTRNPAVPFDGNVDVSGEAVVPVDAHSFGLWLRAMFGLPVTTAVPVIAVTAGPAVDKGSGKVGIPCAGHGLAPGAPVVVSGSASYDGPHVLQPETSADELVVQAAFVAEAFDGGETVQLAREASLAAGSVVDKGNGLVGLPCPEHGLPVGASVTVAGTVNYDGTHTVRRGTTAGEIVIQAAHVAEDLDGAAFWTAPFFDHVYTVGEDMPSLLLEKQFPDIPLFLRPDGLKVGSCSLALGESGELTASLSLTGRDEARNAQTCDPVPVRLPFHRFGNFQVSILEGGELLSGRAGSVNLSLDFGLDTDQYTIGSGGVRGDIPEGAMSITGSIEALFKNTRFLDKAEAGIRSSIEARIVNGGYYLSVALPEMLYQRKTPAMNGPKGVKEDFSFGAFHDAAPEASAIVVTLRNEMQTWEE